jgi:hypothetical protein
LQPFLVMNAHSMPFFKVMHCIVVSSGVLLERGSVSDPFLILNKYYDMPFLKFKEFLLTRVTSPLN